MCVCMRACLCACMSVCVCRCVCVYLGGCMLVLPDLFCLIKSHLFREGRNYNIVGMGCPVV